MTHYTTKLEVSGVYCTQFLVMYAFSNAKLVSQNHAMLCSAVYCIKPTPKAWQRHHERHKMTYCPSLLHIMLNKSGISNSNITHCITFFHSFTWSQNPRISCNTHKYSCSSLSSPEMVRSGERHCKFFPHSSSSLDISPIKGNISTQWVWTGGGMLIPDLIIADSERN